MSGTLRRHCVLGPLAVLLVLVCPTAVWIHLLSHVAYCGTVRITLDLSGEHNARPIEVKAFGPIDHPVTPVRTNATFTLYGPWKAYSKILLYVPRGGISMIRGVHVIYAHRDFYLEPQELIPLAECSPELSCTDHDLYDLPRSIRSSTPCGKKNLALLYFLMSFAYRTGAYTYLTLGFSVLLLALVVGWTGMTISEQRRRRSPHAHPAVDIERRAPMSATLEYLLILLILAAFLVHGLLTFCYGQVPATAGFVFCTACFMILWVAAGSVGRCSPSSRKNIRLLIVALYVCVCLAEALLRLSGDYTTYIERRGEFLYRSYYAPPETGWYHVHASNRTHYLRTPEYSFIRTTNSLGLSDEEPAKTKEPDEYRIIALGDSYTEGDGAPVDSTWPRLLLARLKEKHPRRNITCINAGVSGSDPFFEYVLLRDRLLPYEPDLVIVAINEEASDIAVRGGMERFQADGTVRYRNPPWWEWVYASSHIVRLVVHRVLGYDHLFFTPEQRELERSRAVTLIGQSIGMFKELAGTHHFSLLIVCHPLRSEVERGSFEYLDKVLASCRTYDVEHLDMLEYFISAEDMNKKSARTYYWERDGHHNAEGYAAFARGVEWKLDTMGILGTSRIPRWSVNSPDPSH